MGRRSINTTKSGKFMNPTDQARKEARKRELKKNKKQRIMVRMAVLKGKDPLKLIEEMDAIDEMEYDPTQPPMLSERVLKDKRKKLKETFDRVFKMYEREDVEYAMELRKQQAEYEKRHNQRLQYFAQVKNAEQVQLDQIPLPDMPSAQPMTSQIPLPSDIPLPHGMSEDDLTPKSILKKSSAYERPEDEPEIVPLRLPKRKPPGPPPGPPPDLSDVEEPMEDEPEDSEPEEAIDPSVIPTPPGGPPGPSQPPVPLPPGMEDMDLPPAVKQRKIRFEDDDGDSEEEEKDTRLKYKHPVNPLSALQAKMLRIAGQEIPKADEEKEERRREREKERERERERDRDRDREREERRRRREQDEADRERRRRRRRDSSSEDSEDEDREAEDRRTKERLTESRHTEESDSRPTPPSGPPGPPPGLPPGPPPGLPPMMFRPPPLRAPPGGPPRMLPPGPPPGRPPGMPPGPPPGLPPNMRMPPRLPIGPPGVPPMRMMRPQGTASSTMPPGGPQQSAINPNVLSAPPSILKPASKSGEDDKKNAATIEAKPKIKNWKGDVTRFTPTALKVKRDVKDARGRIIKPAAPVAEESAAVKVNPTVQAQMKDDAYETFMKEMENFL